ncbi:hypothetical protein XENTR_v10014688 [Xenopus tropicalis]|nr:hypothetical protein XENTR_v10014688 [Xenopus tropicalis]
MKWALFSPDNSKNSFSFFSRSQQFHSFLELCLKKDPAERWSAEELLQHPFIAGLPPKKIIRAEIREHLQAQQRWPAKRGVREAALWARKQLRRACAFCTCAFHACACAFCACACAFCACACAIHARAFRACACAFRACACAFRAHKTSAEETAAQKMALEGFPCY